MSEEHEIPDAFRLSGGSFKAHADTRALAEFLKEAKDAGSLSEGETVAYETLSDFIGYDVQTGVGYRRLYSARQIALREWGMVFECDMKVGLRLLDDSDKTTLPDKTLRRVKRRVKRTIKKVKTIQNPGSLTDQEKLVLNVGMAQMSLIEQASSSKAKKAIEKSVDSDFRVGSSGALEALRDIDLTR
jgi:hypothetical protein